MRAAAIPLVLGALAVGATGEARDARVRLVVHQHFGEPVRVDGCKDACAEWVRYPTLPPRSVVERGLSRSGRRFYVWSKPDGHPRELDLFETPAVAGPARRVAHLVPGAGGTLRWLEGDRLWHWWGCGTGCAEAELLGDAGVVYRASGAWVDAAPDGRRVVVAGHGGSVVLVDGVAPARWEAGPVAGMGSPVRITWEAGGVRVAFADLADTGRERELRCVPDAGAALRCSER